MPINVTHLTLWPLSIPMRKRFRHAAAERRAASPLIVAIDLSNGTRGYGETHARSYVTGEQSDVVNLRYAWDEELNCTSDQVFVLAPA